MPYGYCVVERDLSRYLDEQAEEDRFYEACPEKFLSEMSFSELVEFYAKEEGSEKVYAFCEQVAQKFAGHSAELIEEEVADALVIRFGSYNIWDEKEFREIYNYRQTYREED